MDINYDNFKNEVSKRQGYERNSLYHDVWAVMNNAENKLKVKKADNAKWNTKEREGWFKHQPSFKFSRPEQPAAKPVTSLYPEDAKDPFDADAFDYDNPPEGDQLSDINTALDGIDAELRDAVSQSFSGPKTFNDAWRAAKDDDYRTSKKGKKNRKKGNRS